MEQQLTDLTKLQSDFNFNALKNNRVYTGQFTIGGNWVSGYQVQTKDVLLAAVPDLIASEFNGPTDTVFASDPRPSAAWFKNGAVWVLGNNAGAGYTDYPIPFIISTTINGFTATINASSVSEISPTLAITTTTVKYRIIDYSVF